MLIDVIPPETEAARRAAESGTPLTPQEYSPGTTLADRKGRHWLVTSYRTSAFREGTPPFEAREVRWVEAQFGPLTVVDAAGHKLVHPDPDPGCYRCPPVPCRCGQPRCTEYALHRIPWASAETTVREAA